MSLRSNNNKHDFVSYQFKLIHKHFINTGFPYNSLSGPIQAGIFGIWSKLIQPCLLFQPCEAAKIVLYLVGSHIAKMNSRLITKRKRYICYVHITLLVI